MVHTQVQGGLALRASAKRQNRRGRCAALRLLCGLLNPSDSTTLAGDAASQEKQYTDDEGSETEYEDESNSIASDSSESLTESVLNSREQLDLTAPPISAQQADVFEISHHMIALLQDGRLFEVPIDPLAKRVLDVGTGTGLWVIDVADSYPPIEVIGTDVVSIQPTSVPPNSKFLIDDAELPWTYQPGSLDFIHIRNLSGNISDWPRLYAQAWQALKPGGWIEHFEFDVSLHSAAMTSGLPYDHPFSVWTRALLEAGTKTGKPFDVTQNRKMKDMVEEAGFLNVTSKTWDVPVGDWHPDNQLRRVGIYNAELVDQSLDVIALWVGNVLGMSTDRTRCLVRDTRSALLDQSCRPFYTAACVYGRKLVKGA